MEVRKKIGAGNDMKSEGIRLDGAKTRKTSRSGGPSDAIAKGESEKGRGGKLMSMRLGELYSDSTVRKTKA